MLEGFSIVMGVTGFGFLCSLPSDLDQILP